MNYLIIADSSSLILLAKAQVLQKLVEGWEVWIPPMVYQECVNEKTKTVYPDAVFLEELIQHKKITVHAPSQKSTAIPVVLDEGEAQALCLALEQKGSRLLVDDGKAIKAARLLKQPYITSPSVVLELYQLKKLPFAEAKEAIERLSIFGRYRPDIIARVMMELKGGI